MNVLNPGKVNEYLHLVDTQQFGRKRVLSVYIAEFDKYSIIFDCGTSFDVKKVLRYIKKNNISLTSVKYIVPSHYHFDHMGGIMKIYDEIKKFNPDVKIVSSQLTMEKYNNFENEPHFLRSKKTFDFLMGELKEINEYALKIIEPIEDFGDNLENFKVIDSFRLNEKEVKFTMIKTPGHSPDHACSLMIINNEIDFIFLGEALGLKNHPTKLVTIPSSAAPDFNYNDYMSSVKKLKNLYPLNVGFSHFGMVIGRENIREIMDEHETLMRDFRKMVIRYYSENPETKYILDKILPKMVLRTDLREGYEDNPVLIKLFLGVIYGMMMDLGYRKTR